MNGAIAGEAKFTRAAWIRALQKTAQIVPAGRSLPTLIEDLAQRDGDAPALSCGTQHMSYAQLSLSVDQYARWGRARHLASGDTAALLMGNCPEYPAIWLGLTRLGVAVALINSNLSGHGLAHSIALVDPKVLIVGADQVERVAEIKAALPASVVCCDSIALAAEAAALPQSLCPSHEPSLDSTALYIYTSGTTGMPKAAKVSHFRLLQWSHWFAGMMDVQTGDRMYNCLPLYHSVGGVVACCAPLVAGASVVIRPRFSASDFWRDVREERCTLFQYIGELCRYLVNSPAQAGERDHSLRLACGNGLRPEVWQPFKDRFAIPQILEYYAATEGNFSLYNCEGRPGAIGRIPAFLSNRAAVALVRWDARAGQPQRDASGRCERCAVGEAGEALGRIDAGERIGRFEGYASRTASEAKILRDVFAAGDAWYRSGDLMRQDADGFFYFLDRLGDTYRWKGENVSTTEVLSVIAQTRGVIDGVVYGTALPGTDGRAGAAALIVDADFDLEALHQDLRARLPAYARPVFIRLIEKLQTTATFKPRKQEFAEAGIDPAHIADPIYYFNPGTQRFTRLDSAAYAALAAGEIRL